MDLNEPEVFDSEDELGFDIGPSSESFPDSSSSSYTLDSGLSSGTQTAYSIGHSPAENYSMVPSNIELTEPPFYHEIQQPLIKQAIGDICSRDEERLFGAAAYLFHVCRNGYSILLVGFCPELLAQIHSVVRSFEGQSHGIMHFLSGILHYISHTEPGADRILCPIGLELLSMFLSSPVESVLYYTVTALHSLLLVRKHARDMMRETTIVNRLIQLLNFSVNFIDDKNGLMHSEAMNPKFLAILCDCLHILAYGHEKTKYAFLDQDALPSLLKLIRFSHYEKLLWTGVRLLRVLSAWIPIKMKVLSHDPSMIFLTHCLSVGSSRVTASALWTLRNLSDLVVDNIAISDINFIVSLLLSQMRNALDFLESPQVSPSPNDLKDRLVVCRCILDIVGNLTCGTVDVKCHLVKSNAVELISRISQLASNSFANPRPPASTTSANTTLSPRNKALSNGAVLNCRAPTWCDTDEELTVHPAARGLHFSRNHCLALRSPVTVMNRITSVPTECSDLLEAGFRCLSHLTCGHPEAPSAINSLIHSRSSSQLVSNTADHVLLPLLTRYTCRSRTCQGMTDKRSSGDPEFARLLHLLKAWCSLLNNLSSTGFWRNAGQSSRSERWKNSHRRFPKLFYSHARRSLRSVVDLVNQIGETISEPDGDLVTAQHLLRTVTERFSTENVSISRSGAISTKV